MAKPKKDKKSPKKRVPTADGEADTGHNMKVNRKEAKALFDRLDAVHAEKASKNGEFMAQIKDLYEEGKNTLGLKGKIIRMIYAEHRFEMKKLEFEKAAEAIEIDQADKLRLALGSYASSPLGAAAVYRREISDAEAEMAGA